MHATHLYRGLRHARGLLSRSRAHAKLLLGVFVVIVVAFVALAFPDQSARFVWRHWHLSGLALALDKGDAQFAMDMGNSYFGASWIGNGVPKYDIALAQRAFEKAVSIDPTIILGHYQLARIAFAEGNYSDALTEIDQELADHPYNLRSLYVRGLIYAYRGFPGDPALAEADFRGFIAWSPTEWAGYNDLAWVLMKEDQYREAESELQQGLAHEPKLQQNPWIWNSLGVSEANLGKDAAARASFLKAQTYANALTDQEWRGAYSSSDPQDAGSGLASFKTGIQANLASVGGA